METNRLRETKNSGSDRPAYHDGEVQVDETGSVGGEGGGEGEGGGGRIPKNRCVAHSPRIVYPLFRKIHYD